MQEILNDVLQIFTLNSDAIVLTLATGIATVMVFVVKYLFSTVQALVKRTATTLDDNLLQKIKEVFKNKISNI